MSENVVSIKIGEKVYTQDQAWNALRFVVKRGYVSQLTPNPDRTVYEVDAPPPVPNVGQDFKYIGTPGIPSEVRAKLGNIDLPRGEAGDDYARLQERVASLEKRYEVDRFQLVANFKSLETWLQKLHNRLSKVRVGQGGFIFLYPGDWNE